jgi:hypothetical membrane protein
MYEAFGRGDIPAILAALAEDVEWEYGVNSTDVPWLQPRRGRAAVAGFFEALGAIDFHSFRPKALLESGPTVVSLIDLDATVRAPAARSSSSTKCISGISTRQGVSSGSATAPTPIFTGRRITADVRRLALRIGIAAPLLWLALIAWGDLYRPDIDAVTDYISELGERGSSTAGIFRGAGFLFTGFLYVVLAAALPIVRRRRWRVAVVALFLAFDGIGRMGAGVYPCDPGCDGVSRDQELHGLFATVGFSSGVLAALAAGVLFRRRIDILLGLAAAGFLLLLTWEDNPIPAIGLWERLATAALSVWLMLFSRRWQCRDEDPPS